MKIKTIKRLVQDELPNENHEFEEFESHDFENGEAPYFAQPDQLRKYIPKPSGNMVRIRCVGAGEVVNQNDIQFRDRLSILKQK